MIHSSAAWCCATYNNNTVCGRISAPFRPSGRSSSARRRATRAPSGWNSIGKTFCRSQHARRDRRQVITGAISSVTHPNSLSGPALAGEWPLVAAQPGIWVADQISPHRNAYAVAHAIELNGPVAVELLLQAILQGLGEVDMLRLRFAERDGVPVQWWDNTLAVHEPELVDLTTSPDPEAAAR